MKNEKAYLTVESQNSQFRQKFFILKNPQDISIHFT